MTADNNFVTLADVEPDTIPVLLTNSLGLSDQVISVASTSEFSTFSGISTSQGYVKINGEIIYYTSVGVNQLGIGTRGVDGTIPRTHETGDRANKYELNGFDLREINKDHDMASMPVGINNLRDIDTYYLSLSRGVLSSGDTQVSFKDESNVGGVDIDTVVTPFGAMGMALSDNLPSGKAFIIDLAFVSPVFLNIPGKGTVFIRDLDQDANARIGKAVYMEMGYDFGPPQYHCNISNIA